MIEEASSNHGGDIFQAIVERYAGTNPWLSRGQIEQAVFNVKSKHEAAFKEFGNNDKYQDWVLRSIDEDRRRRARLEDAEAKSEIQTEAQIRLLDEREKRIRQRSKASKKAKGFSNKYDKKVYSMAKGNTELATLVKRTRDLQRRIAEARKNDSGIDETFGANMSIQNAGDSREEGAGEKIRANANRDAARAERLAGAYMQDNADQYAGASSWSLLNAKLRSLTRQRLYDLAESDKNLKKTIETEGELEGLVDLLMEKNNLNQAGPLSVPYRKKKSKR